MAKYICDGITTTWNVQFQWNPFLFDRTVKSYRLVWLKTKKLLVFCAVPSLRGAIFFFFFGKSNTENGGYYWCSDDVAAGGLAKCAGCIQNVPPDFVECFRMAALSWKSHINRSPDFTNSHTAFSFSSVLTGLLTRNI